MNRVHFFPVIIWVVFLLIVWYMILVVFIIPNYYKVMRGRRLWESFIISSIKESEYLINIIKNYFFVWVKEIIKVWELNMIIKFSKNNIEKIERKMYTEEVENINDIGYVFKVSDDIVYARGLLKVQMLEMIKITLKSGEIMFGIVNYLDNEKIVKVDKKFRIKNNIKYKKIKNNYFYRSRRFFTRSCINLMKPTVNILSRKLKNLKRRNREDRFNRLQTRRNEHASSNIYNLYPNQSLSRRSGLNYGNLYLKKRMIRRELSWNVISNKQNSNNILLNFFKSWIDKLVMQKKITIGDADNFVRFLNKNLLHMQLLEINTTFNLKKNLYEFQFVIYAVTSRNNPINIGSEKLTDFWFVGEKSYTGEQHVCMTPIVLKFSMEDLLEWNEISKEFEIKEFFTDINETFLQKKGMSMDDFNKISDLVTEKNNSIVYDNVFLCDLTRNEIGLKKDFFIRFSAHHKDNETLNYKMDVILRLIKSVIKEMSDQYKNFYE